MMVSLTQQACAPNASGYEFDVITAIVILLALLLNQGATPISLLRKWISKGRVEVP